MFYESKLPKVNSHIRFGLRYLHDAYFSEFLEKYIRPLLIKGVPSVIQEIKEFYSKHWEPIGRRIKADSIRYEIVEHGSGYFGMELIMWWD